MNSPSEKHWHDVATEAVRRVIPNEAYKSIAVGMATCKPFAADYVLQAPVIVLAACHWIGGHPYTRRNLIRGLFAERIADRPKLRELMRRYGVAYPLRTLRSTAVAPAVAPTVMMISRSSVHPSALAQAAPSKPLQQARWLKGVAEWSEQLCRLADRGEGVGPSSGLEWAIAAAGSAAMSGHPFSMDDIADFYASDPACFSLKWTFDQAKAAAERWHRRLAARRNDEKYFSTFGVGFAEQIDYSPLPLETDVGGLTIKALDSGEELFAEGAAMRHCVYRYAPYVIAGRSRIFSIREGDRRLATLELELTAENFRPAQLRGPCNAAVSNKVCDVANRFVDLINSDGSV